MIRALVIDDSAYNRVTLTRLLESHPDIRVVGTAVNGEDGIKQVMRHSPDVITLDLEMPVLDGFAFLRWLMANKPTAVIVVSSKGSDRSVFKALELGAVDFIAKPDGRVSPNLPDIQKDLTAKVLQVTELHLDNLQRRAAREEVGDDTVRKLTVETCLLGIELVVIGASTGGPPALQHMFASLARLPVPFVVAQHMPPLFTGLFAERLNRLSPYEVKEAADGALLAEGTVYISPGGMQTEIHRRSDGLRIHLVAAARDDHYAPSVDRLFKSASEACEERLVAVVLTGMGDDGAAGIREVHERGGKTIAESAQTAIIYGMPGEAVKTGAVDSVLPLGEIPSALRRLCTGN